MIVAQLRRAFSARLVGGPGSGKSVCAYQVAGDFAAAGWTVRRIRDASNVYDPATLPSDDLCLLLIDDAHLMPRGALQQIEETAGTRRLVLSVHNGVEDGSANRGVIVLDARRAVKTIATELLARPEQTLAAVRRADDDVGVEFLKIPLERRIDDAATNSDRPWQFCFVLGGGWKRSNEAADAARLAGADLVLAAAAIIQIAARDAPLALARLRIFSEQNGVPPDNALRAISWLVAQRLLLSDTDCRCPHQRFALVVLGKILEGQDEKGRTIIGNMLNSVVRDARFPISGLRVLLHELKFLGDSWRWTGLVHAESLEPLITRCCEATSADDRAFAALLFSDLNGYVDRWSERIREFHIPMIADWITTAEPPAAYGLSVLLTLLRNHHATTEAEIVAAVNPEAISNIISAVTAETADHCAELIKTIGWKRSETWKTAFNRAFDHSAAITLASSWPSSAPLSAFAQLCAALASWDEELGLEMVHAFTPTAQKALMDEPVSTFRKLEDIFDHVLRLSDPLGIYVGKIAPNRRRSSLGKAMCRTLKPELLASQLSATSRRDFQDATFFLGFLKKAVNSKFKATVEAIDWLRIARTIGDGWANLSHQDEIFLTISYSNERARAKVTDAVIQNFDRIEKFSPRLGIMMPEVVVRHLEAGKQVRLGQHQHYNFRFGAILIAQLGESRPDLIEPMLLPFEPLAAAVLSQQNASWFKDASLFVEVLRELAPTSLQRILSAVDAEKAEAGWTDSLQQAGTAKDAVALLIESALPREDAVGDMARRLRKKYRNRSVPKNVNAKPTVASRA